MSSWKSMAGNPDIRRVSQHGYSFDAVGFNTLRPYMNNVHFRRAMEYLTNYAQLTKSVLQGVMGYATPFILPCAIYPGACFSTVSVSHATYRFSYSLAKGANELLHAGLVADIGGVLRCTNYSRPSAGCQVSSFAIPSTQLPEIAGWYRHQNPAGSSSTTANGQNGDCTTAPASWNADMKAACKFTPALYYRSDDPLRSGVALALSAAASSIGFSFDMVGIIATTGGAYPPSSGLTGVANDGSYDASCTFTDARGLETGCNTMPTFINGAVNATDPTSVTDRWDMYTLGWAVHAPSYYFQGQYFNSQFMTDRLNFLDYYNRSVDHDSDSLLYASHLTSGPGDSCNALPGGAKSCSARGAAKLLGMDVANQVPYLMSFFVNSLDADNVNGWTGFANVPSLGPNSGAGVYYSLLNLHPTASADGGSLAYAVYRQADTGGMDPLYNTNWVWQTDVWGEFYDTPLSTPPAKFNQANVFFDFMTTKHSAVPYSGFTGTGPEWTDFQLNSSDNRFSNAPVAIAAGENVSFTFRDNITFSDGVPLTASDYNFSLYAWDIASQPTTPDLVTPLMGQLSGPAGLLAVHVTGNRIDMYVGSNSVWNLANLNVPVLPMHVLQHFNIDKFATGNGAVDTTLPFANAVGTCPSGSCTTGPAPTWLQFEPNLEIGTGPFALRSFDGTSGSGQFYANINYARTEWKVNATRDVLFYGPYPTATAANVSLGAAGGPGVQVGLAPVQLYIYNPTASAFNGVAPGSEGFVMIPGANLTSTTIQVFRIAGRTATPVSVTLKGFSCDGSGQCSGAILLPAGLTKGSYEVIFTAAYDFMGLSRTWYQFTGFSLR